MTPIHTERLILRNWEERDRTLFHWINADNRVMEFFPHRRNRAQSDALFDRLRDGIDIDGFGFAAVELAVTGETIGFVGIASVTGLEPHVPDDGLEIGWRLAHQFWGKGYVTEAATVWLDRAFYRERAPEVWSFAVSGNERSIAVMRRLGMTRVGEFDHPHVPDTHPQLVRHDLYRIDADAWKYPSTTA